MKKSTKFVMAAGAMMMFGSAVFAQRITNMEVTMTSPATGAILMPNVKTPVTIAIKNNGAGNLVAGDTIFYVHSATASGSVGAIILTAGINSGSTFTTTVDTIASNGTGTADQTVDFCIRVLDPNTSGITVGGVPFTATYSDPDTTNNDDCNSIVIKKGTTSIFEFSSAAKEPLKMYPNPATDNVTFELNLTQAENVVVSVKDITGREVMRKDFGRVQTGNKEMSLDISRLRAGLYIMELNGEEKKAVGRFTKK